MPTIAELTQRQQQLVADRHTYTQSPEATAKELDERAKAIKAIQAEVIALITAGAVPCRGCGNQPHGMQRQREVKMGEKKILFPIFEVGCLVCQGPEHRFQAVAREEAVALWNAAQQ